MNFRSVTGSNINIKMYSLLSFSSKYLSMIVSSIIWPVNDLVPLTDRKLVVRLLSALMQILMATLMGSTR